MAVVTTNLGVVTAYGDAVAAGYKGTKEEWQALMASYATVAEQAKDSADAAAQSAADADSAKADAITAKNNAETAKADAITAKNDAQTAKNDAVKAKNDSQEIVDGINAKSAQIDQNTDEINELKSGLTTFESDGVAPSAKQLLSKNTIADSVPYLFRQTGGGGADREYVDAIIGGTVNWNQIQYNITAYSYSVGNGGGLTVSISDNYIDITGTATERSVISFSPASKTPAGHVLVYRAENYTDFNWGRIGFEGYKAKMLIYKHTADFSNGVKFDIDNGETVNIHTRVNIYDITDMFGSTIADHIYSLEQSTAGAGVEFFRKLFPNDYYEYNKGELVSVSGLSAHVMRDADDNIIGNYPLDSTVELRGLFKLDANNNLYADGDTYDADGKVTRKRRRIVIDGNTYKAIGVSLNNGVYYTVLSTFTSDKRAVNSDTGTKRIITNAGYNDYLTVGIGNIYITGNGLSTVICLFDQTLTDITSINNYLASHPIVMEYELATPTTEEATPYRQLQICDPNGTEEFVSTGIVPVGHETRYPENLRAKIEGLPWDFSSLIAPTEKTTTASRNYTEGSLLIMNNTLYKVTANIANGGTITPNTNVTATTLSEILSALAQ